MGKKPEIRYLKDLKSVLLEPQFLTSILEKKPAYFIFRGIKKFKGLRYDITIIPPLKIGKEFIKTKGHYHLGNFGEIYKVLAGKGIFLMQKKDLSEVYFVEAKRGEFVKIPPNFGHTTINPSNKLLKISNFISEECLSDYKSIEKKKGFCYYLTTEGWIKNKNYKRVPSLKKKKPLKKMPKNLKFLYG